MLKGYLVYREYTVEEILKRFKEYNQFILKYVTETGKRKGVQVTNIGLRMKAILNSQTCVGCDLEGNVFRLEKNGIRRPHLNLYHKTPRGDYIMLTRDHIIPKSVGGLSIEVNQQVMCSECNSKKGNRIETKYFTPELIGYIERELPQIIEGLSL